jgi:hypothetical protein
VTDGLDTLGRPAISEWMKAKIDRELASLPPDKRGAVVVIGDGLGARAHVAARMADGKMRVAASAGFDWKERRARGEISVEVAW